MGNELQKSGNAAKTVQRNSDGSMTVETHKGEVYTIPANEKEIQAFVVFTMLGIA